MTQPLQNYIVCFAIQRDQSRSAKKASDIDLHAIFEWAVDPAVSFTSHDKSDLGWLMYALWPVVHQGGHPCGIQIGPVYSAFDRITEVVGSKPSQVTSVNDLAPVLISLSGVRKNLVVTGASVASSEML